MKVLILDNYDSFTYNLVHILGSFDDVELTVCRNNQIAAGRAGDFDRIVFSPGPGIPDEAGIMKEIIRQLAGKIPMLGVCLGHQAIAEVFGARLKNLDKVFHGVASPIKVVVNDPLFDEVPAPFAAGRYHSWVVETEGLPADLEALAFDGAGHMMALRHRTLPIRGVQFHPESVMTEHGMQIMRNFLYKIPVSQENGKTVQS